MESLKDKVIIITGASGGMGKEIIKSLKGMEPKFALCSLSAEGLEELTSDMPQESVLIKAVDVTEEAQVKEFFEQVKEKFGKADILLNLAGLSRVGKIWDTPEEIYDTILDVNVKGTFLASKYFITLVPQEGISRIVNVSSMAAKRANGNAPLYCTAKAAVDMFSQAMAIQLKEKKIQVVTLNPGATDTDFWAGRQVDTSDFMKPSDIAEVVKFILTFDSRIVFHQVCFESFSRI